MSVAIKSTETLPVLQIIHTNERYNFIVNTIIFQLASVAVLVICGSVLFVCLFVLIGHCIIFAFISSLSYLGYLLWGHLVSRSSLHCPSLCPSQQEATESLKLLLMLSLAVDSGMFAGRSWFSPVGPSFRCTDAVLGTVYNPFTYSNL